MNLEERLGTGRYKPKARYVCFLPFRGEFGWYIMMYVKRFHAFNHERKVVCTKPGHECLFPTAQAFFYGWEDNVRGEYGGYLNCAGRVEGTSFKRKVAEQLGSEDIEFIGVIYEKLLYADVSFVPRHKIDHGFETDVVIAPRCKDHDPHRNLGLAFWQTVVDEVSQAGLRVSSCGARHNSYPVVNAHRCAADYVDVDTDVELMRSAKVVVTQDSGLLFLALLCERPVVVVGDMHPCVNAQRANPNQPLWQVQRDGSGEAPDFAHRVAAKAIQVARSG